MNKSTRYLSPLAKSLLTLTLGIGVVTNLSGCVGLLVGGAVVGAAVITSDRRTVSAQAEDTNIDLVGTQRIDTTFGKAVHVNVNSYNHKVLLTGEVTDEATKMRVEDIIKAIEKVNSVVNEIQVTDFLSSFGSRSSDTLISTKVKATLLNTPDIYSSSFKVVTENGVVYLMGRVSRLEADTAIEAVRGVPGVQKVVKVFEYIDEKEAKKYSMDNPSS